jgi:hypothetical protein
MDPIQTGVLLFNKNLFTKKLKKFHFLQELR